MSAVQSYWQKHHRFAALLLSGVIGVAFVGFFLGINDGVPVQEHELVVDDTLNDRAIEPRSIADTEEIMPAVGYLAMRRSDTGPTSKWSPALEPIPQPAYDPSAVIDPSDEAKRRSLASRSARRAYNGAPPIVPHAIEGTSDAACYACHGKGVRIGDRVANRMSHGFLANCLQCHAPPPPKPFAGVDARVDSSFIGLPAPMAGERAYSGAPPTIPHSTWMRSQCLSCHGLEAGWAGLETTHPWRTNCLQCHAPSAELEQGVATGPAFFAPLQVEQP